MLDRVMRRVGGTKHSLFLNCGSSAVRGQTLECVEDVQERIFLRPFGRDGKGISCSLEE